MTARDYAQAIIKNCGVATLTLRISVDSSIMMQRGDLPWKLPMRRLGVVCDRRITGHCSRADIAAAQRLQCSGCNVRFHGVVMLAALI